MNKNVHYALLLHTIKCKLKPYNTKDPLDVLKECGEIPQENQKKTTNR